MKPKIIFMGTPDFAVPSMQAIYNEYGLSAVVTTPDKAKGRGLKIAESDVKIAAKEFNIPILQPDSLKDADFYEQIKALEPDIIAVVAFRILPKEIYKLARIGAFNIHGSLLPKYRGAAPINWALINGDEKTGLTTFLLNDKVDTGNLILQREVAIHPDETLGELWDKLKAETPKIALDTLEILLAGNCEYKMQDEILASKAPKIFPPDCKIDWTKSAQEIKNHIRGVTPHPGAWTTFDGKRLKIAKVEIKEIKGETGTYIIDKNSFLVFANDYAISLIEIQPEGKALTNIKNFINGFRGDKLGLLQ